MKTIGLIGGMSWESTQTYYQILNQTVKAELGGLHSAQCLLYSVDFHDIEQLQQHGEWDKAGEILANAAINLEKAGADFIVLCTNTMHKVADQIKSAITIPFLHIAQVTTKALQDKHITRIALLGTRYTMEQNFYKDQLISGGIEVLIPNKDHRRELNQIIFDELCLGKIIPNSKKTILNMIDEVTERGAEGVILGCTEIGMLIHPSDTTLPLFDTTFIHAQKAAYFALGK